MRDKKRKRGRRRRKKMMKRVTTSLFENLPISIINEILEKLDMESLCCIMPTCKLLGSCASQALYSLQTLDLSAIHPNKRVLSYLLSKNKSVTKIIVNCTRIDDSAIQFFATSHIQELVLLKCYFSPLLFVDLGLHCSSLRLLDVELVYYCRFESSAYDEGLRMLCMGCPYLESLCIRVEELHYPSIFDVLVGCMPERINNLQLKRVTGQFINQMVHLSINDGSHSRNLLSGFHFQKLQCLKLFVDHIRDSLLLLITQNLYSLVKLDLQDAPEQQDQHHDLSNVGMQALGMLSKLSHLSIVRSRENSQAHFNAVNDMGIFMLAEGCKILESLKLGGFRRVTDAGFSTLIQNCQHLKTFELYNTFHLSDLAFHDISSSSSHSLVSIRLISCNLITSEAVEHIALCESLEVLDLTGCKSVADDGMKAISRLKKLNSLSLSGADVTDVGMSFLGAGAMSLASLSLRGCKRVTDHGLEYLVDGSLRKTLRQLDLGYMPAISDRAVRKLVRAEVQLFDLSIRNCFSITHQSLEALSGRSLNDDFKGHLKRLDLYNCKGLSSPSLQWFKKPFFPRLRWVGLGATALLNAKDDLMFERPCLSVCLLGCEAGCCDRWKYHQDD